MQRWQACFRKIYVYIHFLPFNLFVSEVFYTVRSIQFTRIINTIACPVNNLHQRLLFFCPNTHTEAMTMLPKEYMKFSNYTIIYNSVKDNILNVLGILPNKNNLRFVFNGYINRYLKFK